MKPTGLLVAVALLAVLGAGVWWSNRKQAAAKTDTATKILSIPADGVQEVRLKIGRQHRATRSDPLSEPERHCPAPSADLKATTARPGCGT